MAGMIPFADYHMHTPLCGHAAGQPEEYAKRAVEVGLEEIGFSDHAPLVSHEAPGLAMSRNQLPEYHAMIEDVRKTFEGKLRVKVGIEADFLQGYEDQTKVMLENYPYDYVIGSVHYIEDWGFDNPDEREGWNEQDVNAVYRRYYELLRQSAQSGLFDIMGHVDLVKKFGHRPTKDIKDEIKRTADVFKEYGVAVEINTSGLRKPVKEIYPGLDVLKIYAAAGIPLVFGSDSHKPDQVGCDFDKGLELAKAAGYTEYVFFKDREVERIVKF